MKFLSKSILVLLVFITASLVYSESNIYEGIDDATKELIQKSDDLIKQRKYESAFNALGKENTNQFIIYKKTEICISYFVQSIGHQLFALRDLEAGEDIYALRAKGGKFTMYRYDPVEVVTEYYKKNPQSSIIEKALGDYYFDVSIRYPGNWYEKDIAVAKKSIEHYENAFLKNFYTISMLTNCADKYSQIKNADKAIDYNLKALSEDPTLYNVPFNLSSLYYAKADYKNSLIYGEKAISIYKNNQQYQMDAILICSEAAFALKDYNKSIQYLDKALKITKGDYRIYNKLGKAYMALNNLDKVNENMDALFSLAPTNPAATQMVLAIYDKNIEEAKKFFVRNIDKYKNNKSALGNLYFHYSLVSFDENNKEESLKLALLAKDNFIQANVYKDALKKSVDELVEKCK